MKSIKDINMILAIPNLSQDSRWYREQCLQKAHLIDIMDKDMEEAISSRYEQKYHELYHIKQSLIKENTSYSIAKAFYDDVNKKRPFIL